MSPLIKIPRFSLTWASAMLLTLLPAFQVVAQMEVDEPEAPLEEKEVEILTNETVIELHEMGFGGHVLVEKISTTLSDFDVSINGLTGLKEAGLSDDVIASMIASAGRGGEPASLEPAGSGVEDIPAVQVIEGDQPADKKSRKAKKAKKEKVHYPIRTPVSMKCAAPALTPLEETSQFQEHGGIQISVAVLDHRCVEEYRSVVVPAVPTFKDRMMTSLQFSGQAKPTKFVEETRTPYLKVVPESMRFSVKITNKLPRVFRGAGIVVQYVVAGKLVAAEQEWYGDLVNAIIPPRMEQGFEITGPEVVALPEQATFGLFLYDVVTATDEAGNITERHNFEWYFNYYTQVEEREGIEEFTRGWWVE